MMTSIPTEDLLRMLLAATAETKAKVHAILSGQEETSVPEEKIALLSISEAARMTHLGRTTIYKLIHRGELTPIVLCGIKRIRLSEIAQLIQSASQAATSETQKGE